MSPDPMADPVLTTERLSLRRARADDVDEMMPFFTDAHAMRFIGDGKPRSKDRVLQMYAWSDVLAPRRLGIFVARRRVDDAVVGDIVLVPLAHSGIDLLDFSLRGPEVEIGYRLLPTMWGQGFATEAARAVARYAFSDEGPALGELHAVTNPANEASKRVLLKIGLEARGETDRFYGLPCAHFSLTRAAWRAFSRPAGPMESSR